MEVKISLFVIVAILSFCKLHALVYQEFEDLGSKQRLTYGILHLGDNVRLLNTTGHESKFHLFTSFYLDLFEKSYRSNLDEVAVFCQNHDVYLKDKKVLLQIQPRALDFLADCLKNVSEISNHTGLQSLTVLTYDKNVRKQFKKLQRMRINCGFLVNEGDFAVDAQEILLKYQKYDVQIDTFYVIYHTFDVHFYNYDAFSKAFHSEYKKLQQAISGFKPQIIMELFLRDGQFSWTELTVSLISKFLYRWGEQDHHSVVSRISILRNKTYPWQRMMKCIVENQINNSLMLTLPGKQVDEDYLEIFKFPDICTQFKEILISIELNNVIPIEQLMGLALTHSRQPCKIAWNIKWNLNCTHSVFTQNLKHISAIVAAHQGLIVNIFIVMSKGSGTSDDNETARNLKMVSDAMNNSVKFLVPSEIIQPTNEIKVDYDVDTFYQLHSNASTGLYLKLFNSYEITPTIFSHLSKRIKEIGKTPVLINLFQWSSHEKEEFGGCYQYKTYIETVKNWATVNHFKASISSPDSSKVFQYSNTLYGKSWFKNTNLFGKGYNICTATNEELRFLSNSHDTCVTLPTMVPNEEVEFSSAYSGVTLNFLAKKYLNLEPGELADLFRLVHFQFSATEIVLSDLHFLSTITEAIKNVEAERHSNNTTLDYFLNINSLPTNSHASHNLFGNFSGVHTTFCRCKNDLANLQLLRNMSLKSIGISINYDEFLNASNYDSWQKVVSFVGYAVIRVNLAHALLIGPYSDAKSESLNDTFHHYIDYRTYDIQPNPIFDNLRAMRMNLRRVNDEINVYIQIAWPRIDNSRSTRGVQKLWAFLDDFSREFEFPFFLYEAFDTMSEDGLQYGWWKLINDTDFDNPNNYVDRQADFYKLETQRPKVSRKARSQNSTSAVAITEIMIGVAAVFLVLLCSATAMIYRLRQTVDRLLTDEELQEFEMGKHVACSGNDPDSDSCTIAYNKEKYEIDKCEFNFDSSTLIGSGFFSLVYKATISSHEEPVAVKVPKLVGAYTKEVQKGIIYVITEYMDHGSLLDYLRKTDSMVGVELYQFHQFCFEISMGMNFLSEKKVIHGDLSARNVLLDVNIVCKISDFGLSRKLYYEDLYVKSKMEPVPWKWMAIETLERSEYSLKSDIWSLGVTFWEIFSFGEIPYQSLSWDLEFSKKLKDGLRLPKPKITDLEIYEKMLLCWSIDTERRPSTQDLIGFFQDLKNLSYTNV